MELESLSGESRSAASSPSPTCGAPSQVHDEPLPAARLIPLRQVVQCWTKPEVHGSPVSDASSVDVELTAICRASTCDLTPDDDPNEGRSVYPQENADDCWLGDASSLLESEDDESDLRSDTSSVRIENVGDCHLSDASSFTELDDDPKKGRTVFPQGCVDDCWMGDASSLLVAEDDGSDLRNNTSSVRIENVGDCHLSDASSFTEAEEVHKDNLKTSDDHSLRDTISHRQALPLKQVLLCWEGPLVTKERDCGVPTEEDSVMSIYLEPEHYGLPVLDGDWADAPISTQQTPSPVLLQEGLQRRKGVCPWLRRLGNALRNLGKRKRMKQSVSKEMGMKRFLSCFCCFS